MKRSFFPGSEWVYIKLYTSEYSSNKILLRIYSLINQSQLLKTIILKYFFVRYNDPDHHIRFRFLLSCNSEIGAFLSVIYPLFNELETKNEIWKIQFDTYFREMERYDISLIGLFESMFYFDSVCTLKMISIIPETYEDGWLYSILMVDSILSDFNLCVEEKRDLMFNLSENTKYRYNYTQYNRKQLNEIYRLNKNKILKVFNFCNGVIDNDINKIINERSKSNVNLIAASNLRTLNYNSSELMSYIHMSMNRYFKTSNNIYELIIYDFLYRYYCSSIARNNIKNEIS